MNEKISKIIDVSIDSINNDLSLKLNNSDDTEIIGGNSPLAVSYTHLRAHET